MNRERTNDVEAPDTGGKQEAGSSLLMVIFIMALLTSVGIALLFVSQTEVKMNQADLQSKQVFYVAEAGLEDGREQLRLDSAASGTPSLNDELTTAAGSNGIIDFDPATVTPQYDSDGNFTHFTGFGDDQPLVAATSFAGGWYAAFLTNDQVPPDTRSAVSDTNDRVMLVGVAVGPDRSFEVVESVIEPNPMLPSTPPATITLLGPSPDFDGGGYLAGGGGDGDDEDEEGDDDEEGDKDGGGPPPAPSKTFEGNDCAGSGIPGLYVPTVGVAGSAAEASAEAGMYPSGGGGDEDEDDEEGGGGSTPVDNEYVSDTYSGEDTVADLTDLSEPTVGYYGTLDPGWTNCQNLHDMVEDIRGVADHVCTGDTCSLPATSSTSIVLIDGDLDLGPATSGEGLLLVTGTLDFDADASWSGMLFVIGEGVFRRTGTSGSGVISGATVVADIAGPDDVYGTGDDCTGGSGGFDVATYHEADEAGGDTVYCTNDINPANPNLRSPYDVAGFRQR